MKGQRVTGKVLLLQIQGDAQSLLRFLFGSGWEAAQAPRIISLQLPSPIYTPAPKALGMKGNDPVDLNGLPSRIHANLLHAGISIPDFFNLSELTQDFQCAAKY